MITFTLFTVLSSGYVLWGFFRLIFQKDLPEKEKTDIKLSFIFVALSLLLCTSSSIRAPIA